MTRLYENIRDVIYWDFGQGVNQLLGPGAAAALPVKPFYYEGILRKLPDDVDRKESTDTPITECSKESSKKCTDESSSEPSNESTKVKAKVDDQSKNPGPRFHAAAEALKHLSEQDFKDMSEYYYVDPYVEKLLELEYWRTRSRKGKERSSPYSRWRTEQPFIALDGVTEFTNPKNIPTPPPRPKTPRLVKFYDMVEKRAIKHDPGIALQKQVSPRDAERSRIRRRTYDKDQPVEILKRRQGGKINYSLEAYRSTFARRLLSVETPKTPAPSNSLVPNKPPSNADIARLSQNRSVSPTTVKPSMSPVTGMSNGFTCVPSPLKVVLQAESPKPVRPAVSAEHMKIPDSPRPSEQTLLAKASTSAGPPNSAVFAKPNGVTHTPKPSAMPLCVESPTTAGPLKRAGEPNGTPNVLKSSRMPLRVESPTIAESSTTAELRNPTGTAILLDMGWNAPVLKTVDEVLEFAGVLPPRRPSQKTESTKPPASSKLLDSPKIADSLIVPGLKKLTDFAKPPESVRATKGFSWSPTRFGISFTNFLPVMLSRSAGASSGTKFPTTSSGSSKSDEPVKPAKLLPSLAVSTTLGLPVKRPSPTSVQQLQDVKRRRKDSDAPESPKSGTLCDEEENKWSEKNNKSDSEASTSSSVTSTLVSVDHNSCTCDFAGYGSPSEPNASNQARKRSASFTQNPTEVKRRGQVGGSAEPPMFMMLVDSRGRDKMMDSDRTDRKALDGE